MTPVSVRTKNYRYDVGGVPAGLAGEGVEGVDEAGGVYVGGVYGLITGSAVGFAAGGVVDAGAAAGAGGCVGCADGADPGGGE